MFIDEIEIKVIAGRGGDGCSSFRHEKYIEMGGPDGGNGGSGGSIIFEANEGLKTLIDLRYKKLIKGNKGTHGSGAMKTGANGEDIIIKVPVGTTVIDSSTNLIICDLIEDKQTAVVAKGGKGGRGNASFKSNRNKAPLTSEYGLPGEEKTLKCELKLLADVGLVGFPSVGKSSLISVISASKPKIADYPFTTLSPNLGVVSVAEGESFVVADLPGIIEGASEGKGLGDKFLKHALRTRVICYVIDMSLSIDEVINQYETLLSEVKNYSEKLFNKKSIVVCNKMDYENSKETLDLFKSNYPSIEVFETSAVTREGLTNLKNKLYELVSKEELEVYEQSEFEDYVLYKFKAEKPYIITRENDHTWVISGEQLETLLKKTKFNSNESSLRFARKLKGLGVDDELRKLGAKEKDIIRILDYEFEYEERLDY